MSDLPDYALVGALACTIPCSVPSQVMQCMKCDTDVWVSDQLIENLSDMGYRLDQIKPVCLWTCMVIPEGTPTKVTDDQRKLLNAKGIEDDEIDRLVEYIDRSVQRGEVE